MQTPSTDRRLSESDSESAAALARSKLQEDEEDEISHSHLMCCSTSIRSNGSRKWRCRCNLMLTFAIVCGISVIFACILIWYIGYASTTITVNDLTSMLRASTLRDVLFKVNDAMAQPLRCAHALRYMYNSRFPDFGSRTSITNETGWLADFTFVNLAFPSIIRMGITNTHNLQTAIYRPASNTQRVVTAASGQLVIEIAEPANYSSPTVTFNQFIATPIRNVSYSPPTNINGEIFATDSADDIRRFVGDTPKTAYYNYNPRGRPFYLAAQELLSMGLLGGWSDPFFSIPTATSPGFVALAAVSIQPDPVTGQMSFLSWSLISTVDLHAIFASLDLGEHGRSYLVRPKGRCAASSSVEITNAISQSEQDLSMQDGSIDPLLPTIYSLMLEWRLVTDEYITLRNASAFIDMTPVLHSRSIVFEGSTYTVEAQLLDGSLTSLPYSIVIVTRDADWDGNVRENSIRTIWISAIVCVVAVLFAVLVSRMVTRDLISVVYYMGRAVRVIEMERSETQRRALATLCEKWSSESNQIMPIIKTSSASPSPPDAKARGRKRKRFACFRVISRGIHESKLLQRAFGSVLHSLASYDELEVINQAKRQFIRYIFHEVRVPFNAIVLGIESMQMELKNILSAQMSFAVHTPMPTPLQLTEHRNQMVQGLESCSDTLGVLREQSDVVSHILNDVLSMQKIEDGALVLEFDAFSIETMIRGALYAFRSACVEKKLKVELEIASVDHFINSCPVWIPHLGRKKSEEGISPSPAPNVLPALMAAALIKTPSGSPAMSDRAIQKSGDPPKHRKSTHGASVGSSSWVDLPGEQPQLQPIESEDLSFSGLILGKPMTDKLDPTREMIYHAEIRADNYRLRQCVANFISNAIKFTPLNGQITVKLQLSDFVPARESTDDAHTINIVPAGESHASPLIDHAATTPAAPAAQQKPQVNHSEDSQLDIVLGTINIRVSVKDTGVGISEENAKSLFQQYMQINANKNQQGAGSGLGLNISKSIIELHGGRIGVNSSPGVGSEFWFELPTQVVLVEGDTSSTFSTSISDFERSVANLQSSLQSALQIPALQVSDGVKSKTLENRYSSLSPVARMQTPQTGTSTTNGTISLPDEISLPRAAIHLDDQNAISGNPSNNPSTRNSVRNSLPRVPIIRVSNLIESALAGESGTYTPPPAIEFDETVNSVRRKRRPSQLGLGIGSSPSKDGNLYDNPPSLLGTPLGMNGTSILQLPQSSNAPSNNVTPRNNALPSLRNSNYVGATSHQNLHAPAQDLSTALPRLSHSASSNNRAETPVGGSPQLPAAIPIPKERFSSSHGQASVVFTQLADDNSSIVPLPAIGGFGGGTHPNQVNSTPEIAPRELPRSQTSASSHNSSPAHPARRSFSLAMDPYARPATPSDSSSSTMASPVTPATVTPATTLAAPVAPAPAAQSKAVRVLVVEDSMPNRKLLMSLLSHMKCVADGVENGQECVDRFPPHVSLNEPLPYDIVIMDGSMPVMNGVEATQLLRARGVQIPILALTGNALAEDIEAFMQAGCTTVLTKPINRAQLQKAIHTYSKHLLSNK